MPGVTVKVLFQDIKKVETEALVVGFHEDVRPLKTLAGELDWLLCGALSRLIIHHNLRGALGDAALLTSRGKVPARKIFLVGLGPRERSAADLTAATESVLATVLKAGVRQAALEYFAPRDLPLDAAAPALFSGIASAIRGRDMDISVLTPHPAVHEKILHLSPVGVVLQQGR